MKGLCLILDQSMLRAAPGHVMDQALAAGVKFFQYRNKTGSRADIYRISLNLAPAARKAGALFIINDHADIAVAVDADGVHLGQDDIPLDYARKVLGPEKIIGISTHDAEQARKAAAGGADYIGFGPLFQTTTKDAGPVQGLSGLTVIAQSISIPVIAIGGISRENVSEVMKAGADGVAVISAILSAPDIRLAAEKMLEILGTEKWRST